MNKKAIELAISTLVLFILGILILAGLILFLTGSFDRFSSSTKPFLDTAQSSSIKLACTNACDNQDKLIFCCKEYEIDKEKIKCSDKRLELSCTLDCKDYSCT
ncbi:MAG: hypothetical protein AABX73_01905 [Nanoarchaeota archaeon]